MRANVAVYDLRGRLVRSVQSGPLSTGSAIINLDRRDSAGRYPASGRYVCIIGIDGAEKTFLLALSR